MYHLVYTSHAKLSFSKPELIALLDQSRVFNKEHDITGMLIYQDGKFIQVLEGEMQTVRALYYKIQQDPRHRKVNMVLEGDSPERIFKDWSMGFKNLRPDEMKHFPGFKNIDTFFQDNPPADTSHMVLVFLQLFYKKNLVDYPELSN